MNMLLYAPQLTGHPQVYVRVITRALLTAGHHVTVACPAQKQDWLDHWPNLRGLADEDGVRCLDSRNYTGGGQGHATVEQLVTIQKEAQADATLLIEADGLADEFRRMAADESLRLRGRVAAIFSRTSAWYPREDFYTGEVEPMIGPTVRRTLGRAKRALFNRRASAHYFYESILLKHRLVDALIVKDERLPPRYGAPVTWMPEIYRVFDVREDERRHADWHQFADPVQEYVRQAGPDNVLLYFGTGAWYKGYDWFLKLALDAPGTYALHAGAPERGEPGKRYDHDVMSLRDELLRQGRLFETRAFIKSEDLVDLLFASISRFVSTHRLSMSSGTLLQALEAGKPVLTPASGLVGWRTKTHRLGMTYPYGDAAGLRTAWQSFRHGAGDPVKSDLASFIRRFSRDAVEDFFVGVMEGRIPS